MARAVLPHGVFLRALTQDETGPRFLNAITATLLRPCSSLAPGSVAEVLLTSKGRARSKDTEGDERDHRR